MEPSECGGETLRRAARGRLLALESGELLARVPSRCFRPGARSVKRTIAIPLEELLPGMLRGRVTVALGRLAELCPELFSDGLGEKADLPIELPLARLVGQVAEFAGEGRPMGVAGGAVIREATEGEGLIAAQSPLSGLEEMIRFNLSSVLRGARGKIWDGPVDPAAQVGVPLDRVEEQLATGRVVFTAAQLAPGVPESLRGAFEAAGGTEVEIPLDEVFKNLPGGETEPPAERPAAQPAASAPAPASLAPAPVPPAEEPPRQTALAPVENARIAEPVEPGILSATGGPDVFGRRILAGGPAIMLAAQQSTREGGGDAVDRVMGGFEGVAGVTGCAVVFGRDLRLWGELPGGIDPRAFREQAWEMMDEVARRGGLFGLGAPDSLTWRAGNVRATLMARGEVCVCAFHGEEELGDAGRASMEALLGRLLAEL